MRQIHVIEVKDATGAFTPQVGFADLTRVEEWMAKFLPVEVRLQTEEWRIVRYVPLFPEESEMPLLH